jgi:molybdopterin synthase sulfur carrier subunit
MRVWFSTHLRAYTGGAETEVDDAPTVLAVVDELDRRHPGLKFRIVDEHDQIREHIIMFRNTEQVRDLREALGPGDRLRIMGALSGG